MEGILQAETVRANRAERQIKFHEETLEQIASMAALDPCVFQHAVMDLLRDRANFATSAQLLSYHDTIRINNKYDDSLKRPFNPNLQTRIPAQSPSIAEILGENDPSARKPAPSRASIPQASTNTSNDAKEDDKAMRLDPPVPDPPEYAEAINLVRQAIAAMDDGMKKVDAQIRIEVAIANLSSDDEVYRSRT